MTRIVLVWVFVSIITSTNGYRRICYYDKTAANRPDREMLTPADIDPSLCSHLVFASGHLLEKDKGDVTLAFFDNVAATSEHMYAIFNELKDNNPNLKTLYSLGSTEHICTISSYTIDDAARKQFVQAVIRFLRAQKFDGIDVAAKMFRGSGELIYTKTEIESMAVIVQEIKRGFQDEDMQDHRERLILSFTTRLENNTNASLAVIHDIAETVDFLNLLMVEHHNQQIGTQETSSLRFRSSNTLRHIHDTVSVAEYWNSLGVLKAKVNIGISLIGKRFSKRGSRKAGVTMNDYGDAKMDATPEAMQTNLLSYYEVCSVIETTDGKVYFDEENLVPSFVSDDDLISFEDSLSVTIKINWLKQQGFGGAVVWYIDRDDFNGFCHSSPRRFPITSLVNERLQDGSLETPCFKNISCVDANTECVMETNNLPKQNTCKCTSGFSNVYGECKQDGSLFANCLPQRVCSDSTMECVPSKSKYSTEAYCDCKSGYIEDNNVCKIDSGLNEVTNGEVDAYSITEVSQTDSEKVFCVDKQCGVYGDPDDCSKYYVCGVVEVVHKSCPSGLWFNINENMCDLPGSHHFKCR